MAITAVAVTLVCVAIIVYDLSNFKRDLESRQLNLLKIVNSNIAAAVVFEDNDAITENLRIYEYQPEVIAVIVTDPDGRHIADFHSDVNVEGADEIPRQKNNPDDDETDAILRLQGPIKFEGKIIGFSEAQVSLEALNDRLWLYIRIGLIVMSVTLLAAYIIARKFARLFSGPVENLVNTAQQVSKSGDYSIRAELFSGDEIGDLTSYFNEMLDEIEQRDNSLILQRDSLEKLVTRKTGEIQEALEDVQAASKAKSEFLANMSHELRTPLNAILGFSEVLGMELYGKHTSDKYRDYAGLIHDSGNHLLNIINDLLDLARIEAGKIELTVTSTDVAKVVSEVSDMMMVRAVQRQQSLDVQILGALPLVECDGRIIKQIFLNLVSNSIKFTPNKGVIKIILAHEMPDTLKITVSDTGRGMTDEDIKIALQPFGQTQSVFARSHEGTGLGLPLVEQFLKLHHTTMQINSVPQKGTDIVILLPTKHTAQQYNNSTANPQGWR